MEAEQAEKLEINQQGEQFQVLDPAKIPDKPFKPAPFRILLMGIFISLGLGVGLVFLLEYLRSIILQGRRFGILSRITRIDIYSTFKYLR